MGELATHDAHARQKHSRCHSVLAVLQFAGPLSIALMLGLLNDVTNVVMLGQSSLDPAVLAAVGLGNLMQNTLGLSMMIGLTGAFDTFVSQAHGAGEHDKCVLVLQRGRVIITAQLLWIYPLIYFSEEILLALRLPADVAKHAGE